MYFLIVSGMSGAGKSRAVATFEDLGYYCVDNLPIALIPRFAEICLAATERYERVALVTDVRAGGDFQQLFDSLDSIKSMGCDYRILFLNTDTPTLIRRFKETRRKHPLMEKGIGMTAAIEKERSMLAALQSRADFVVDTTGLSAAGLRERLLALFAGTDGGGAFEVIVQSFGFKYGIPPESDLVFDVRFLPNPYYEMSLREKNGTDPDVRDYVFQGGMADELMQHLTSTIDFLLPRYVAEGKANVIISIGCTGGKHRSVAIAEALSEHLRGRDYGVVTMHRDYQR
ncbi:RNase adapter RapZ [Agathobaculum sp. NSJ-28]|uniref:RNase adapter RapZ n=2 Tax=Agathobaculum TaxID=2048137 RepID=A0A923LX28_9FIRM|nr:MULTISPECIES: RNase adapter RapZ [Agathobaculum]MBC5725882.1 RNase adapter RapZ [Agathobaculum faecis]MCU6789121.1 RNase adapter RapZ [Agathobaculum ammoniilyticum]SCJ05978.1 glmZ(sRNA)-inactivating NTPase [uncultured Butyricicoccus sp.]